MKEGIDKAVNIIKSLMSFSFSGKSIPKKTDIHKIIDNTLLFINHKLDDNIVIEKDYNLKEQIEVYPDKIHQVFLNILDNAIYAIKSKESPNKEKILISTQLYEEKNDRYAIINIFNTGPKIDENDIHKIFDTFFTTKDPGSGTGLGLSISYSMIRDHAGEIKVENKQNGVEFSLILPLDVFLKDGDIE
jgi:signal transduction histidine kinase